VVVAFVCAVSEQPTDLVLVNTLVVDVAGIGRDVVAVLVDILIVAIVVDILIVVVVVDILIVAVVVDILIVAVVVNILIAAVDVVEVTSIVVAVVVHQGMIAIDSLRVREHLSVTLVVPVMHTDYYQVHHMVEVYEPGAVAAQLTHKDWVLLKKTSHPQNHVVAQHSTSTAAVVR
jgi:hypothetical protein